MIFHLHYHNNGTTTCLSYDSQVMRFHEKTGVNIIMMHETGVNIIMMHEATLYFSYESHWIKIRQIIEVASSRKHMKQHYVFHMNHNEWGFIKKTKVNIIWRCILANKIKNSEIKE